VKLQNIYTCGIMAVALKCYYHVGRVNTFGAFAVLASGSRQFRWHERDKVLLHTPEVGVSTAATEIPDCSSHQYLRFPG